MAFLEDCCAVRRRAGRGRCRLPAASGV